jgi:hypothetical protein
MQRDKPALPPASRILQKAIWPMKKDFRILENGNIGFCRLFGFAVKRQVRG